MIRACVRRLALLLPIGALGDAIVPHALEAIFLPIVALVLLDRRRPTTEVPRWVVWGGAYLLLGFVSTVWGGYEGTLDQYADPLPIFARCLELLLIAPVIFPYFSDSHDRRNLFSACAFAGALYLGVYFYSLASGSQFASEAMQFQQYLAAPVAMATPLVAAAAYSRRSLTTAVLAVALVALMLTTGTRTAPVAATVGSLAALGILARQRGVRWRTAAITAAVLLTLGALPLSRGIVERFAVEFDDEHGGDYGRIRAWKVVLLESRTTPVLGRGVGAVRRTFYDGDWARILHETGIAGLMLALVAASSLGRMLLARRGSAIAAGLFGALIVLGIRSAVASPFLSASEGGAFLVLLGALPMETDAAHDTLNSIP